MSGKYTMEELKVRDLGNKKEAVKRIRRRDDKKMTAKEVRDLYFTTLKKIKETTDKDAYIIARCRTGTTTVTFIEPADILDDAEYWDGKVRDSSKFTDFYYTDFHIMYDK